mmetsp:Transcript_70942/g.140807  ORF Transcript_70942/g.140807 Transcript_70942/m.140807 type:complete len:81 (-) Transcript_70942:1767-2009(-)
MGLVVRPRPEVYKAGDDALGGLVPGGELRPAVVLLQTFGPEDQRITPGLVVTPRELLSPMLADGTASETLDDGTGVATGS